MLFIVISVVCLTSRIAYAQVETRHATGTDEGNINVTVEELATYDFELWMKKHERQYIDDGEKEHRRRVWLQTDKEIRNHNSRSDVTFVMGHNQFSDMTFNEFASQVLMEKVGSGQNCSATLEESSTFGRDIDFASIPKKIDWRKMGAVSEVKNQKSCGSCWTFSASGCLESHHYLATSEMVLLSEQQLVDCAGAFDTFGCSGGLPSKAFEYVHYNGGLDTETGYPYKGVDQKCHFEKDFIGSTVATIHNITFQDEGQLLKAIGTAGPVSIAYDVAGDFKQYHSGVYSSTLCKDGPMQVNHAVLAVGYDMKASTPYYIVKNSWGTDWGMDGFFYIEVGKNMCGLSDCASFPELVERPLKFLNTIEEPLVKAE